MDRQWGDQVGGQFSDPVSGEWLSDEQWGDRRPVQWSFTYPELTRRRTRIKTSFRPTPLTAEFIRLLQLIDNQVKLILENNRTLARLQVRVEAYESAWRRRLERERAVLSRFVGKRRRTDRISRASRFPRPRVGAAGWSPAQREMTMHRLRHGRRLGEARRGVVEVTNGSRAWHWGIVGGRVRVAERGAGVRAREGGGAFAPTRRGRGRGATGLPPALGRRRVRGDGSAC